GAAAVRGRPPCETRFEPVDDFLFAPDHHAVAVSQPPPGATRTGVDEVHAVRLELFRAPDGIFVIRIAAVNENVAFGKIRQQLLDRLIYRVARGNHQPDGARQ